MTPETKEKLDYLKDLHNKYGRYVKSYFGFTYTDIANFMGIHKTSLSHIIKGKQNLTDDRELAFNKAFEKFDIYNKSKVFKENEGQKHTRDVYRSMRNSP